MAVSVILLLLGIQLDHSVDAHDSDTSLDSTLKLLELTHTRLQDTGLEAVVHTALGQVEAVVSVLFLLSNGLLFLIRLAFLDALGDGVSLAELRDEFGGVLRGVDGKGLGDDQKGLSEFANCQLLTRALRLVKRRKGQMKLGY